MRLPCLTSLLVASIALGGCSSAVPPTAPDAMLVEQGTKPVAGTGVTGRWAGVGHSAAGSVRVSVKNGVAQLDFSSDFR